ncbi:MAG TPA: peptidylprolyl isomerase [Maritimibacter sp.]|nr:peptidylprolyl isomerase [Maritimibacter sp.]
MVSNISRFFVWIIMGMVLIGLVGFGSFNFGSSANAVGRVGETEIDASAYFRELNAELNAWQAQTGQNLTMAQAQAIGLDQQVLSRVIAQTALDNEVARLGISVGDRNLANRVTEISAFQGADGRFDSDTYDFVLDQSGLTKREFEESLRSDVARTVLAGAVTEGIALPGVYTDTLFAWARETRDFTWAEVTTSALETPVPDPTEADLQAYYDANPAEFTTPETRQITYAWLRLEDVIDSVPVNDGQLRAAYEENIEEYQVPERRLVERLVFGTEGDAQAALDRINAGETSFDDEIASRGLTIDDVDLGEVTEDDLGAASEPVFALEGPGVVGPIMTDLGPALFRMNAVLAAQDTPFEEAREELRSEVAADEASRAVRARATETDELLASGLTLEDLAAQEDIPVGKIGWFDGMSEGIAANAAFRDAASSVTMDDFPEVTELEDGSWFALRLDAIEEPTLLPLDEVRDDVEAGWRAQATQDALEARAQELIADFQSGESPATMGLTEVVEDNIARTGFIQGTPPALIETVFDTNPDTWTTVTGGGQVIVMRVNGIDTPDQDSAEARQIKTGYGAQVSQQIALDVQDAFATAIEEDAGVTIDQAGINAVHANFP